MDEGEEKIIFFEDTSLKKNSFIFMMGLRVDQF